MYEPGIDWDGILNLCGLLLSCLLIMVFLNLTLSAYPDIGLPFSI